MTTQLPYSVKRIQSPWRQTPGYMSKYDALVERAVLVAPQPHRHRRHRLRDHELAELADDRVAVRVERVGGDAQQPAGDLALVDRHERRAADDAAAHVRAAAAVDQQHVRHLLVDVPVAVRRERRSGGAEAGDRAEVVVAPGLDAGLAARRQERGRDAHEARPELLGEPPLPAEVGIGRVAVEHHDRRAHEQRRDERVPHHPGRRRVPEETSAGLQVPVQRVRLQVLEQDPAVAVHDRLRAAGRPGREQDEQRMVERHLLELERAGLCHHVAPGQRVVDRLVAVRDVHDALERRQRGADRRDLLAPVDHLRAVAVARDREEHLRLELHQAVDHAARAELGRAAREGRAEARGRGEQDERLGDVRHVRGDDVAAADAEPLQAGARPRDLLRGARGTSCRSGRASARARRARSRRGRRPPPAGARRSSAAHRGTSGRPASPRARGRPCTAPTSAPRRSPRSSAQKRDQVVHGPPLQVLVRGERQAALVLEPPEVPADLGRSRMSGGGDQRMLGHFCDPRIGIAS